MSFSSIGTYNTSLFTKRTYLSTIRKQKRRTKPNKTQVTHHSVQEVARLYSNLSWISPLPLTKQRSVYQIGVVTFFTASRYRVASRWTSGDVKSALSSASSLRFESAKYTADWPRPDDGGARWGFFATVPATATTRAKEWKSFNGVRIKLSMSPGTWCLEGIVWMQNYDIETASPVARFGPLVVGPVSLGAFVGASEDIVDDV